MISAINPNEEMDTRRLGVNGRENAHEGSFRRQKIKPITVSKDWSSALFSVGEFVGMGKLSRKSVTTI